MTCNRVLPCDIAVINGGPHIGLMGRIVKVVSPVRPSRVKNELFYIINGCHFPVRVSDGVVWRVHSLGAHFALINQHGQAVDSAEWPCRDAWLYPLRMTDLKDQMLLRTGPAPIATRLPRRG